MEIKALKARTLLESVMRMRVQTGLTGSSAVSEKKVRDCH